MRCLNCHTVCADTDRKCISCGAPIGNAAHRQPPQTRPFFSIVLMIGGAVGYNVVHPPDKAVAANGGKINMEHVMWAGVVGAICASVGGLLDVMLGGERKKKFQEPAARPTGQITLQSVSARRNFQDSTPQLRPKRPETSPPPRG